MACSLRSPIHSLRFVLTLVILANTIWAQQPPSRPAPAVVELQGQVRYSDRRAPAEKVLVRLEGFGSGLLGQTLTDSMGKFRFSGLGQAQYVVTVRAPGYVESRQSVDLQTTTTAYLQFQLVPEKSKVISASPALLDARIPPEAEKEYEQGRAALLEERKLEGGIAHLEEAVRLYPDFFAAQLLLGTAYMDARQWERAERTLRRTLEINPKAASAHIALGEVYRRQEKYQEAEQSLQEGLRLDPRSAQGHFTLGQVYFAKGDLARAGPAVGQALRLKPDFAPAYLLAGNILLRARQAENALQMFEEYLRLEPKGALATETRALVERIKQALSKKE